MPRLPKTVTVPADYAVWLEDLRKYLDKQHGARADLARHLAELHESKFVTMQVRLATILNQGRQPSAAFFLDMAAWLAMRTAE